jgi:HK97 family phage major capsid protein
MSKILVSAGALAFAHHAAFRARLLGGTALYEVREVANLDSVAKAIESIGKTFEEYKKANDERIDQLAKKGSVDPLTADKLKKMDEALDVVSEIKKHLEKLETRNARPGGAGLRAGEAESPEAAKYRQVFLKWMRAPADDQRRMEVRAAKKALYKLSPAKDDDDGFETRATQTVASTGAAGGFALPEMIEREIQRLSLDISPLRQLATVRTVGTTDYKELFDLGGAAFEWVGETDTRSQTNTPDMAEVAPTFGMASAKPQASEESLDDLFFDVESWLKESVGEAMAQGEGVSFISGNGTKKPTGFLNGTPVATDDASRAFGVLQFIASGQAAALPTDPDKFLDVIYALRARYRANATWLTSKLVLASLRKYKDTTGAYLWQPTLTSAQPDTFMGYPIAEAEDMPSVAANAFPLAFGDFKQGYLIADRVGMRITRDEITTPGFVKFYIRKRVGGILRNTQAIKLLKIAA